MLWDQKNPGNSLIVLPTGSGKSLVIADFVKRLNKPVLIFAPTREILSQNLEKLATYVNRKDIGVYSASMSEKTIRKYTFATIQSCYKKPEFFGHFETVIMDECHLFNPKNLTGMFNTFLEEIGNPKVIGLTATPYRMAQMYKMNDWGQWMTVTTTKLINRMKGWFWKRVLYHMNNEDLLVRGFLAPMEYVDFSRVIHTKLPLNISQSDFDLKAYERLVEAQEPDFLKIINGMAVRKKGVLVFCSSVEQAHRLAEDVKGSCAVVTAKTKKKDRALIINRFKTGKIKVVLNVSVLTIGFDHPELDCIILLRPTRSIALYYQMLGRGIRPAEGKKHCLTIDFTGTVKGMGRIETLKIVKDGKLWELFTETGSWHNKELYSFTLDKGADSGVESVEV